jgi:hypothetical protein
MKLMWFSFCGRDEEHDPCEEFEEYMACSVCGDNGKFIYPCLYITAEAGTLEYYSNLEPF